MNWRKPRRSGYNGNCVEAASWRTSSRRNAGECVETGHGPGVVAVRDSALGGASPVLEFSPRAWTAFLAAARLVRLARKR